MRDEREERGEGRGEGSTYTSGVSRYNFVFDQIHKPPLHARCLLKLTFSYEPYGLLLL